MFNQFFKDKVSMGGIYKLVDLQCQYRERRYLNKRVFSYTSMMNKEEESKIQKLNRTGESKVGLSDETSEAEEI